MLAFANTAQEAGISQDYGGLDAVYVVAQNSPQSLNPAIGEYVPIGDGFCVAFVQAHGYGAYRGNANEWARYINSDVPVIGAVVVLREGEWGHLALVIGMTTDNLWITEQNYEGLGIVSYRTIDVGYDKIVGYVIK